MLDQVLNAANPNRNNNNNGGGSSFSLDQLLTGPGGLATGAAAGGLAAMLMGGAKPKKLAKNALKVGGVALVGGLAYKAWRDWQGNKAPVQPGADTGPMVAPVGSPFLPDTDEEHQTLTRSLLRAMVAAAKADGHITLEERGKIISQLDSLNIDASDHAFIRQELERPADVEAIVRDATSPELAAELYAASLLAIDPEGDAERGYLALLAARLKLEPELVKHLHAHAAGSTVQDAA